jgi:predicted transcriptional regulator
MQTRQSLSHVTARDLMRSPVITLPEDALIEEALEVFEDEGISGVPIVDAALRPVGMLTEHDVARADHLRRGRIDDGREWSFGARPDTENVGDDMEDEEEEILSRDDYSPEMLGRTTVRDWMTTRLVAAEPDLSLRKLCRLMQQESVHRVLILQRGRLQGIVTTSDIVRWLAEHA